MKLALIIGTLMSVLFFTTNAHATGKSELDVPGKECEEGAHKFNPHCNLTKIPKPQKPEIVNIPLPTTEPLCTPSNTAKPVVQETPVPTERPKETHAPTTPTPIPTSTPTENRTPTGNPSPSPIDVPSAEPTDNQRPSQEVRTDLSDGRSDGRTESLGCLNPEDGCNTSRSVEPRILGATLPETGRVGFWGYASFFGAFFVLGLGIYLRFKSFKEDDNDR